MYNALFEWVLREALITTPPEKRKGNFLDAARKKTHRYLFSDVKRNNTIKYIKYANKHNYDDDYENPGGFVSPSYTTKLISKTCVDGKENEIGYIEYYLFTPKDNNDEKHQKYVDYFKLWAKDKHNNNGTLAIDVIRELQDLFIKEKVSRIRWSVDTRNDAMNFYDALARVFNGVSYMTDDKRGKSYEVRSDEFMKNGGNETPRQIIYRIIKMQKK